MNRGSLALKFDLSLLIALAVVFSGWNVARPTSNDHGNSATLQLVAPPLNSASAQAPEATAAFPENEAGISAYTKLTIPIDFSMIRPAFRNIETDSTDYLIGSVPVQDYTEAEDLHVYVQRDGWIVAYCLAADPVGKIFDWKAYARSGQKTLTTRLGNTVKLIAQYAAAPLGQVYYYDFRYPNATNLMLIAESVYNGNDDFEMTVPRSFTFYERSWSLEFDWSGDYRVDSTPIWVGNPQGWQTHYGLLTASQLLPETAHHFDLYGYRWTYAGVALIYRTQP